MGKKFPPPNPLHFLPARPRGATHLIMLNTPIQKQEKVYYTKTYAALTPSSGYRQLDWQSLKGNRKFIHEIKKVATKLRAKKILDLGCGNGRLAVPLAKSGFDVYGIDFASSAIQRANHLAKKSGTSQNTHFSVGNALSLPYPENFFDLIFDYGCLHHISEKYWQLYLKNVSRVLKRDGYLLLYTHDINSLFYKKYTPRIGQQEFVVENVLTHFFDKADFPKIFQKNFLIISAKLAKHPATSNKRMWTVLLKRK